MGRWCVRPGRRRGRGQALVELAVVAPVLLVLGVGVTDFGRVFGQNEVLYNSVREAARHAVYYSAGATPHTFLDDSDPVDRDNCVLLAAQQEMGDGGVGAATVIQPSTCTGTEAATTAPSLGFNTLAGVTYPNASQPHCPSQSISPVSGIDPGLYPTTNNRGYLYICYAGPDFGSATPDGMDHVALGIVWRISMITPFMGSLVGAPLLHGTVDMVKSGP